MRAIKLGDAEWAAFMAGRYFSERQRCLRDALTQPRLRAMHVKFARDFQREYLHHLARAFGKTMSKVQSADATPTENRGGDFTSDRAAFPVASSEAR